MTTVAYKNGWMVSDGRECFKDRIDFERTKKIWRLADGSLFGGAGNSTGILQLRDALINMKKLKGKHILPNLTIKGTQGILAEKKKAFYYERGAWQEINYPYSIGTGSDYALAAMDAGCTAEEAVRIAMKRDLYSGGRLQKYRL